MLSRSIKFLKFDQYLNINLCNKFNKILTFQTAKYTSEVNVTATPLSQPQQNTKKISKAMKAYLERAEEHGEFMKLQKTEYQIGKRHLANMMGEDPETFTQDDIDRAIEYLFPSGIYDKKARPMMKPPEEIFPARKAAEFDESGRPFHSMFYTGKPNFFKLLYDIVEEINGLFDYENRMLKKGLKPDPTKTIDLSGFDWITKEKLEDILVETIADIEYSNFVTAMNRLVSLPYSYKAKEFIEKYQRPLMDKKKTIELPKPQYDENGRMFVTTYECYRKTARGEVTIRSPGTGKITINGQDLSYFKDMQPREQVSG